MLVKNSRVSRLNSLYFNFQPWKYVNHPSAYSKKLLIRCMLKERLHTSSSRFYSFFSAKDLQQSSHISVMTKVSIRSQFCVQMLVSMTFLLDFLPILFIQFILAIFHVFIANFFTQKHFCIIVRADGTLSGQNCNTVLSKQTLYRPFYLLPTPPSGCHFLGIISPCNM